MVRWLIIIFGSLYIIGMWGVLFYIIRRGLGPYFRSKRETQTNIVAKIKGKIGHQGFHSLTWQDDVVRKILVFECADGVEREYDVPDSVWDYSEQGDDGVLAYQGHLFVGFQAYRPKHNLDKTLDRLMRK